LQVSESVQAKYLTQSANAPYSFLASALSIGSACDLNYKTAKNQKLHVEICLLKLANISKVLNLANLPATEGDGLGKDLGTKENDTKVHETTNVSSDNTSVNIPQIPISNPQIGKLRSTSTLGKPTTQSTESQSNIVPQKLQFNKIKHLRWKNCKWFGMSK